MHPRRIFPALVVVLAVAAAMGPPATAAPGEGGGAPAGSPAPGGRGDSGGAGVGRPQPKRRRRPARTTSAKTGRHAFPIAGAFSFGGADGRFGARRKGHRHQGQDLPAASGTPVVAPYRGVVAAVQYQARGAGRYVVIHGADYDYVFMHLLGGSTLVREGERVSTGQRIASVGSSGESSGPHLHFELWLGGWFAGGDPIDPLPLLEEWSGVSPASG
jgi:murein DD-endopeptidase MepM/ murein hydrolase activator NlpD